MVDPMVSENELPLVHTQTMVEKKIQGRNFTATAGCFHPS